MLHEDPGLAAGLSHRALAKAASAALAPAIVMPRGGKPEIAEVLAPHFGLLVLDGTLGARTEVDDRRHLEILGSGDLIRPWVSVGEDAPSGAHMEWLVFEDARLAVLDRRFSAAVANWPELASALMGRLVERARRLTLQVAIGSVKTVERRILLILWHFASRWGRPARAGIVLELPLTHEQLGEIVMARRPTVTEALTRLRKAGALRQEPDGWLLTAPPPYELHSLERQVGLVSSGAR